MTAQPQRESSTFALEGDEPQSWRHVLTDRLVNHNGARRDVTPAESLAAGSSAGEKSLRDSPPGIL